MRLETHVLLALDVEEFVMRIPGASAPDAPRWHVRVVAVKTLPYKRTGPFGRILL